MNDPANPTAADALEIARLATLPMLQYDRERKPVAVKMGVTVASLDREVNHARESAKFNRSDADRPPEYSDDGLALRFTERHRHELRYVAAWGKWLIRRAAIWQADDTVHTFEKARAICRAAAAACDNLPIAQAIASNRTVAAVERLARGDRNHAATADQWDADPWLLNTPGGVIDLRTGTLRDHRADDYMTKITAVAPGEGCPLWIEFLTKITGSDADLIAFLQRAAGYALTGITTEHALFFGYGTGGNGKGTFLNTLQAIMGNYAATAEMDTFTASQGERHTADVAMLRGARLVTAQETEEGRRWAESRIKALTGGDPITAHFMRQDYFTYVPQFKLFIAGNHKPGLRNVDEAIRRRLHLIPFAVKIPADERDPRLADKLRAEWPGILAWAIVTEATDGYLEAEDTIGQWITDCCALKADEWTASSVLFASWKHWAELAGEYVLPLKRFGQALEARGLAYDRQGGKGRGYLGIRLTSLPRVPDGPPPGQFPDL
jgi:putative DNA primase/helicase